MTSKAGLNYKKFILRSITSLRLILLSLLLQKHILYTKHARYDEHDSKKVTSLTIETNVQHDFSNSLAPWFSFFGNVEVFPLWPSWVESVVIWGSTWKPASWTVYRQSVRTNNDVEGWHHRINRKAQKPNLQMCILIVHKEARLLPIETNVQHDFSNSLAPCFSFFGNVEVFPLWPSWVESVVIWLPCVRWECTSASLVSVLSVCKFETNEY
jgi:hypothetical protein